MLNDGRNRFEKKYFDILWRKKSEKYIMPKNLLIFYEKKIFRFYEKKIFHGGFGGFRFLRGFLRVFEGS